MYYMYSLNLETMTFLATFATQITIKKYAYEKRIDFRNDC